MCTTRILAKSAYGVVFECPSCEAIQVIFGTSKLVFKIYDFKIFMQEVYSNVQSKQLSTYPDSAKSIVINHPHCAGFSLVLSPNELCNLSQLLGEASLIREVHQILETI